MDQLGCDKVGDQVSGESTSVVGSGAAVGAQEVDLSAPTSVAEALTRGVCRSTT